MNKILIFKNDSKITEMNEYKNNWEVIIEEFDECYDSIITLSKREIKKNDIRFNLDFSFKELFYYSNGKVYKIFTQSYFYVIVPFSFTEDDFYRYMNDIIRKYLIYEIKEINKNREELEKELDNIEKTLAEITEI